MSVNTAKMMDLCRTIKYKLGFQFSAFNLSLLFNNFIFATHITNQILFTFQEISFK